MIVIVTILVGMFLGVLLCVLVDKKRNNVNSDSYTLLKKSPMELTDQPWIPQLSNWLSPQRDGADL